MIDGLDHLQIAMPAGREEDVRRFYGALLGLPELEKPEPLRQRGGVWFALPDGRQLHLGVDPDFRPAKKAHPCFVVSEGFKSYAEKLREAGFEPTFDNHNPPTKRFYISDPFGNRLEFADRYSDVP